MTRAIEKVKPCQDMQDVRRAINALDDVLVPLLVERIEDIVQRVRGAALKDGGDSEVIEQIYRSMMEACIAFEEREFARLREVTAQGERA